MRGVFVNSVLYSLSLRFCCLGGACAVDVVRLDRYAPEMELVKHAIAFSQRDVEGAVEVSLYKVPTPSASPVSPRGRCPVGLRPYALARVDVKILEKIVGRRDEYIAS